tara:strand:- start:5270 stop:7726 length:2457 start_codon:yes stop_codon:yes gene_type:complete
MLVLLTKRLARSMMRSKVRIIAVVSMVAVAVFAGVSFASYAHTVSGMYDKIYEDSKQGVNLPDVWVENPSGTWDGPTSDLLCEEISEKWADSELTMNECEPRLRLDGTMFHTFVDNGLAEERMVPAVWHGVDEGVVDRVWIPENECCSGRIANSADEVVIDVRVASGMGISLNDSITIGAGSGRMNFTVVGIGLHSSHLYYSQEGSIFPADPGTFATGYLSSEGLERLANLGEGSSNLLLIDVSGTPDFDIPSTDEEEGSQLKAIIQNIDETVTQEANSTTLVYDRTQITSVEFLRADAEGAMTFYTPVTGMIAAIAGITIFLSLQRLVQSQSREIAILRTLGIPRREIMPPYFLMPLAIGSLGSIIGVFLGVLFGAPGMIDFYEDIIGIPVLESTDLVPLVIQIVGVTMMVVLVSGALPAIQAARLQPLEVLRGQHEIRISSRRVQEITSNLPATVGLTIRSSIRKPTRLAFTFLAVGLSMLLFGSTILMMGTMEEVTIGKIEEDQNWDVQSSILPGGEEGVIEWVESKNGAYEIIIDFPANPVNDSRVILVKGMETLSTDNEAFVVLDLKKGRIPVQGAETMQILIDDGLNHFLGWDIGDKPTLVFGSSSAEVEVVGITQGEISRTAYLHRSDLAQVVGIDATAVLIDLPEGQSVDSGLGDVSLGVVEKEDLISSYESILEQQQSFLGAILFLGILIAIVVLFNTLIINLSERDREIATLRVLGAPMNRLGWMMFGEHLAIGLIGGALAFLFTLGGTQAMVSTFIQWSFFFRISADPGVAILLIGIVVLISVALTPYGMRRIKNMDLVEKVKDLSQ